MKGSKTERHKQIAKTMAKDRLLNLSIGYSTSGDSQTNCMSVDRYQDWDMH